jgi:superfamily II RNA helicase
MLSIHKQKIEKQDFSIFLRDLASNVNTNLKHMIEDNIKDDSPSINEKKNYHKNKKKVIKKKDIIIQEQNKKRAKKQIEDDIKKIDFLFKTMDHTNPFGPIREFKTEEGKTAWKVKLFEYFWSHKKKYMNFVILLYFELKETNIPLLAKVEKVLNDYDSKLFMMNELGHMLPPLNNWDKSIKRFDDWQEQTIQLIKNKENVIVKAPTSSGKSFIAMAAGILHKKVLYICPAKPVAYQVGAHFTHMGYKVHFLLDNLSHYSYDARTNIFIGTPKEVENNINKIGTQFDYVVYDEIHNLNKQEDGDSYENLIKLLPCNFVALSATIQNIEDLQSFFQKTHTKKIHLIEYNKRFINHQRWIWKGELVKLHPFCAYSTIDDIKDDNLSFTPNDCASLWESIADIFDYIDNDNDILDGYSPDDYFPEEKLLSLDDCKEYELFLKGKLVDLEKVYPKEVQDVFNSFNEEPSGKSPKDGIIDFIKDVKKRDMFPILMFHTNEMVCKEIFHDLYEYLNNKELEEYPFHYIILEKKEDLFQSFKKRREIHKDGIKVTSNNPEYEIRDKLATFDKKEKSNYLSHMNTFYHQKLNDIKRSEHSSEIKSKQTRNLKREISHFALNPDFHSHDIFQKHKSFIFTTSNEPMSGDTIRSIRREIKKTLGIKIPYESPLFQLLKRGIGLYIENMPDEYNWILQKLLAKKEIGVVISDKTLCMGIDLPVRSSCFLGIDNPNFTNDDYLQMSGRAGRRGLDNKGNIIFYGDLDYISLMNGSLPKLQGNSNPIYENYKVLKNPKVFDNMINPNREVVSIDGYGEVNDKKLLWYLRNYKNAFPFTLTIKSLERQLFMEYENDRPLFLLSKIDELIGKGVIREEYKYKKILDGSNIDVIKEYINVLMFIHNELPPQKNFIIITNAKILFETFNQILFNHIILK